MSSHLSYILLLIFDFNLKVRLRSRLFSIGVILYFKLICLNEMHTIDEWEFAQNKYMGKDIVRDVV